ncbi:MAG: PKD domain-containing protein [Bacteroidota bacterium]
MKNLLNFLFLTAFLLNVTVAFPQKTNNEPSKQSINDRVDTRVDNMRYWMKMAEKGLTPFNPHKALAPAIFKGSEIKARGVRTTNSPDVPVTNLTDVTESENSVFIDPNNADYILNSNNSTSWSGGYVGTLYGANYFQSPNAGIGWVGSPNGAGGPNSGDPTTAISLNGRQYVNFIDNPGGQGIAYSDDGTAWTAATVAANPGDMADKNHMWIDNKITSPYEGNIYVAWTDFGGADDAQIKIARSVNDGVAWGASLNISSAINAGSHNQGVNIQTGPNGEIYAAWAVYDSWPSDETAIGFAKSSNGGVSFATATRIISNIKGIRTTAVNKDHRVNSFPVMAVDISGGPNNGNIYIVWTNIGVPGVNSGTNKSVYIIRSTNGGTTWSTPVRVNQGPNVADKEAYFPWISCDPATGVLSVIFYDDRNVLSTQCEVFTAYSTDAGTSWTDFQVSDVSFTPAAIPGLAGGYMGDYLGITSQGGKIYPCWTDNRGGLYMTYVSPFELGLNAGFSTNNTTICTSTGVTFSDGSSGPPTSWNWSFPGGTPSAFVGKTPPGIIYNAPGTYDVSLTVSDGITTDTETKTGYITVKDVIAGFTGAPTSLVIGNSVTFTDNSSCSPATWEWTFPGGTPSSFNGQTPPAIFYNTLGTFDVSLTVTKPGVTDTKTRTGYIIVGLPIFNMTNGTVTTCTGNFYDSGGPSANYSNNENFTETFYPSTPGSMTRFTFTSFSTESGYDYLRIYDGVNTAAPLIGIYNGIAGPSVVTASNAAGAITFNFTSDVSVTSSGWSADISCYSTTEPPVADFSASQINPVVAQTITFSDLSSNFPTSWSWSFSPANVTFVGGTNASSQNPQVQFSALGFYSVSLNVTNAYGSDSEIKTNYIHVTNCTFNALPFAENFNGTTIPNCWYQIDHQGNGQIWQFGVITGQSPNPALTGNYAYLDSDTYGSGNSQNADLISPSLDLSAYTGITLQFDHYFQSYYGSSGTLSYSINNGSTWTQIQQFVNTSATNPAIFNQTLAALSGQSQVKFKWNYTGNYGWYWGIDNILVTGVCIATLPVSVSITASSNPVDEGTPVIFSASPVNGGTSPVYQWKVNGVNAGTNSNSYTYIPVNGDVVACILTSSATCVSGNPATSNTVTMTVTTVPVILNLNNITVTGLQCFNATQTIVVAGNQTTFTVQNGGAATLIAGQNIIFHPGSVVLPGGMLHGYIAPNGPYCMPPVKSSIVTENKEKATVPEKRFFRVYPNPTTGEFTVALDGYVPSEKTIVEIYSMKGERIISTEMTDEMTHQFSLVGKPSGLYVVRVVSQSMNGTSRIVKQ